MRLIEIIDNDEKYTIINNSDSHFITVFYPLDEISDVVLRLSPKNTMDISKNYFKDDEVKFILTKLRKKDSDETD